MAPEVKNKGDMLEAAATVTKITKQEFGAIFDAEGSYVVKGQQTDKLFEHEQLHLKIAEYIATKALANVSEDDFKKITVSATGKDTDALNDALQKKIDGAVAMKLDEYVKKWKEITRAVQESYDSETNHGTKPTEQADWVAKYQQFADAILKEKGWTK